MILVSSYGDDFDKSEHLTQLGQLVVVESDGRGTLAIFLMVNMLAFVFLV